MAMQYLPTVAMRSNPKTWLKTIFIIQRNVLESYFCSRSWSLYILWCRKRLNWKLRTNHWLSLKILWCNSSRLTVSVMITLSLKHNLHFEQTGDFKWLRMCERGRNNRSFSVTRSHIKLAALLVHITYLWTYDHELCLWLKKKGFMRDFWLWYPKWSW